MSCARAPHVRAQEVSRGKSKRSRGKGYDNQIEACSPMHARSERPCHKNKFENKTAQKSDTLLYEVKPSCANNHQPINQPPLNTVYTLT